MQDSPIQITIDAKLFRRLSGYIFGLALLRGVAGIAVFLGIGAIYFALTTTGSDSDSIIFCAILLISVGLVVIYHCWNMRYLKQVLEQVSKE